MSALVENSDLLLGVLNLARFLLLRERRGDTGGCARRPKAHHAAERVPCLRRMRGRTGIWEETRVLALRQSVVGPLLVRLEALVGALSRLQTPEARWSLTRASMVQMIAEHVMEITADEAGSAEHS
eukprot:SAG11_NODE_2747_length_3012_cov_1.881909_4_plen_126_part_00